MPVDPSYAKWLTKERMEKRAADRVRIIDYMATHLFATQKECGNALGLSRICVCRHAAEIRKVWRSAS